MISTWPADEYCITGRKPEQRWTVTSRWGHDTEVGANHQQLKCMYTGIIEHNFCPLSTCFGSDLFDNRTSWGCVYLSKGILSKKYGTPPNYIFFPFLIIALKSLASTQAYVWRQLGVSKTGHECRCVDAYEHTWALTNCNRCSYGISDRDHLTWQVDPPRTGCITDH